MQPPGVNSTGLLLINCQSILMLKVKTNKQKKQRQNTAFPLKSCQNEQFHGNSSLWPNTNCCHHTVRLRGIRFMMDKSVTTGHQNGNINFENCVSKTICCGAVLSMCCSCLTRCIKGSDEGNRVSFSVWARLKQQVKGKATHSSLCYTGALVLASVWQQYWLKCAQYCCLGKTITNNNKKIIIIPHSSAFLAYQDVWFISN